MKIYPYVDMTRANADGTFPVYVIVKRGQGRFFVNTGMTTCGRLEGREFPKQDKAGRQKTALLGRYLADIEAVCLQGELSEADNAHVKAEIQSKVFGVEKKPKSYTLADCIKDFAATKKEATKAIYLLTARKVSEYDACASLETISQDWLDGFNAYFTKSGMGVNGIGKELRNIRAAFNWARRRGLTQNYPFLDYHIRQEETEPNNLSAEDIRRLRDYPCETWQKQYVDFFMLSFYLAGINPVDLLTLRSENAKDGYITFVRKKTNKQGANVIRKITLPVIPEAQAIIDRYPSREGWLLGFMDCRNDYRSFARVCNDALQKVGPSWKVKDKAGKLRKVEHQPICPDITLYSARYTFGSIAANDLDISERTIGMCLGHSWSKQVTARYIAHDQRKIDNAIRRVVDYVSRA